MTISVQPFNKLALHLGQELHSLAADTIKLMLMSSTTTPPALSAAQYSEIASGELADGNGYTTGGWTLSGVTYTETSGVTSFRASNLAVAATGSGFQWKYAVIYNATSGMLICLAEADEPFEVAAGQTPIFQFPTNGIVIMQKKAA